MILGPVFEQLIHHSPLSVMARATLEHALPASALDALLARTAERGYTRELPFSTTADVMRLVVCGKAPHVQAASKHLRERIPVTLQSVYEKLQHIGAEVSAELARPVAGRRQGLITERAGACQPLLAGYRVKVLDGNHLAATQRRLKVTRGHRAGPPPGQALAVLDPAAMLITDVIPCEDAHAQGRALLEQVLPLVQAGDVGVEGRNFCTADSLVGVSQRPAFFVVRRHGNLTVEPQGEFGPEAETDTGWASERPVWACRDGQRLLSARLVRLRLGQPTQDGDVAVEVLTNLPAQAAGAAEVADLYLKRWEIEGASHELTVALHCEANTLGYPKAALFAFCVAVMAYNVLAVLKAALRAVHGEEKVQEEVSGYYVALGWALVYAGMMIALPARQWEAFGRMPTKELAGYLREWASKANLEKIKEAPPRKPTRHKTRRIKDKSPHLSTARLLDQAKQNREKKKARSNR